MIEKPIIFLAFANDQVEKDKRLQALAREQDELEKSLNLARMTGLCELVVKPNATVDNIIETFQTYRNRICIFHFAGHANGYQILLEDREKLKQKAGGEALVDFFKRQKSLQLIFFNGCSTKKQAEELSEAGIPAVIGTHSSIPDDEAVVIARNFYRGLGGGASLDQAWQEAQSKFKMEGGGKRFRDAVFTRNKNGHVIDGLPWAIYYNKEKESRSKKWNLGEAVGNPLFSLPLPDHYYQELPAAPFPGLHYFTDKDAAIFFGRGAWIRTLYQKLRGVHSVILFYGKSGVGKSSLLFAGLKPRIEDQYAVGYIRREPELGLLGSLEKALDGLIAQTMGKKKQKQGKESRVYDRQKLTKAIENLKQAAEKLEEEDIVLEIEPMIRRLRFLLSSLQEENLDKLEAKWQAAGMVAGRPPLIILDQVEEVFTRPEPGGKGGEVELRKLLTKIKSLYGNRNQNTEGRLLLSFRKEYLPEIQAVFEAVNQSFDYLFLQRLTPGDIQDAVTGVEQNPILSQKYQNLKIEEGLASRIAGDLGRDLESPIAPVLQIIMRKLWDQEQAQEDRDNKLSIAEYNSLENTVGAFFQEQLNALREKSNRKEAIDSGLVLDLLYQHTTEQGTAADCRKAFLEARYPEDCRGLLPPLLAALEKLSILVVIDKDEKTFATLLAHDVLAPVVRQVYNDSEYPGQRAGRILQSKMRNVSFTLTSTSWEALKEQIPDWLQKPLRDRLKNTVKGNDRFLAFTDAALQEIRNNLKKRKSDSQSEELTWSAYPTLLLEQAEAKINGRPFKEGLKNLYLNKVEIEAVEKGRQAMRKLTSREENLLAASRKADEENKRALREANQKLANIWLSTIEESIRSMQYDQALATCSVILELDAAEKENNIKSINKSLLEIAFFYTETEQLTKAADTLEKISPDLAKETKLARRDLLEEIKKLDANVFEELQQRYYPEMVRVEGGKFNMRQLGTVLLDDFKIAKTPTTVWQYFLYLYATGRENLHERPGWGWNGDHPIVNVSWYDALVYANWLSERLKTEQKMETVYQLPDIPDDPIDLENSVKKRAWKKIPNWAANGYRLPTGAEWEYAARGGKKMKKSEEYAISNEDYLIIHADSYIKLDEVAWYDKNSEGRTHPVKEKKANELGLFDMKGHVDEWCWEGYNEYEFYDKDGRLAKKPKDSKKAYLRVKRGGSWSSKGHNVFVMNHSNPDSRENINGFRVSQGAHNLSFDLLAFLKPRRGGRGRV